MKLRAIAFDLGHTLMDERRDIDVPIEARPVHLMPGVADVLPQLTVPLALWGNTRVAREAEVRRWLDRARLGSLFTWVITSVDAGARKPAAAFFACALARGALRSDEVLFVGNQLNTDVAGAEAFGIATVWLSDPVYRSEDDAPCDARPTFTIATLQELPALVRREYGENNRTDGLMRGLPIDMRRAGPSDADGIALAHRDSIRTLGPAYYSPNVVDDWGEGLTRNLYIKAMEGGEVFFIATGAIDGAPTVLGFASAYRIEGHTYGTSVYVRGAAARSGIGSALLRLAESYAAANGASHIQVEASLAGVQFYRANGFVETARGETRLLSGRPIACVFMRKELGSN